mmetsp:Transcript_3387/g.6328  ORF Transcript_3387/g.6328 Transcript_3387/m.6328 type:complete len:104 (-) Transcript_3387:1269-1580(-)
MRALRSIEQVSNYTNFGKNINIILFYSIWNNLLLVETRDCFRALRTIISTCSIEQEELMTFNGIHTLTKLFTTFGLLSRAASNTALRTTSTLYSRSGNFTTPL